MKTLLISLLMAGLAFAVPTAALAPLLSADDAIPIDDHYIVFLKNPRMGIMQANELFATHQSWLASVLNHDPNSSLLHVYDGQEVKGYAGIFSEETLFKIRSNDMVEFIERDQVMSIDWNAQINLEDDYIAQALEKHKKGGGGKHKNKPPKKQKPPVDDHIETQGDAPWGLARISSHQKPSDMTKFSYPSSAGQHVDVYVIDTGINVSHTDFEGRAIWGKTVPAFDQDIDGNGHGTHVAGTIAAKTFGVAKKASVIAVKVLRTSGYGSNADVIAGVEWVINAHKSSASINSAKKSVANMSLGGGRSQALDKVVNAAVSAGVHFAVAAGNDSADACNYSPAAADLPVTVGASSVKDEMAYFSNHGECVDIFAPGLDITSTWIGSNVATNTISGTSMASPHVAGVMALYLGEKDYSTAELKELLIKDSAKGMLGKLPANTENYLLNISNLIKRDD